MSLSAKWLSCTELQLTNITDEDKDISYSSGDQPTNLAGVQTIPGNGGTYVLNFPNVGSGVTVSVCIECLDDLLEYIHPPIEGALKASPGLEGHGTETPGGRGGPVVKVSNAQELEAALQASGPANIVFENGGPYITNVGYKFNSGNKSVFGQTAPSPVWLYQRNLANGGVDGPVVEFTSQDNLLQYCVIRHEPEDSATQTTRDCFGIKNGSERCVVDHCDLSWGNDESFEIWHTNGTSGSTVKDITISYCYIDEAIPVGSNADTDGGLIGYAERVSFHHNITANCAERTCLWVSTDAYDQRCNVVYNTKFGANVENRETGNPDRPMRGNIVDTTFIVGPDTPAGHVDIFNLGTINVNSDGLVPELFRSGNIEDNGGVFGPIHFSDNGGIALTVEYPCDPITKLEQNQQQLESSLIPVVGVTKPFRDAVTQAQITRLQNRTGTWITQASDIQNTQLPNVVSGNPKLSSTAVDCVPAQDKRVCYPSRASETDTQLDQLDMSQMDSNSDGQTDWEDWRIITFGC